MHKTAFNTTDQPVIIDDAGRQIGGYDWGTISTTEERASDALDAKILVLVDRPEGVEINPSAQAAFDVTDAADELASLPADEVKALVEDDDVNKAEAVEQAARSGKSPKGAR